MRKGFAPILIVLIIAVLIAAAYFLGKKNSNLGINILPSASSTPSLVDVVPSETASWKMYMNTKYNYQVKYPNRWGNPYLPGPAYANPESATKTSYGYVLFVSTSSAKLDSIYLFVSPFTENIDSWMLQDPNSSNVLKNYPDLTKIDTSINGVIWRKVSVKFNLNKDFQYWAYMIKNGKGVEIYSTEGFSEIEFDQILSTFKFTQ